MKKTSAVENMKKVVKNKKDTQVKEQEQSLKNLENIKQKLSQIQNEQKKSTASSRGNKIYIFLILGIIIGLVIGLFIGSNSLMLYITNKDWVVPQAMRVKNKNGYFIVNEKDIWSLGKTKVNKHSKIIKIKDL